MNWFGWTWDGDMWKRVCGPCNTLTECSNQLGAEARRRSIPAKHSIMTTGAYPRVGASAPAAEGELPLAGESSPPPYLGGL